MEQKNTPPSVASYVLNFDELANKLVDYLKNGIQVNLGNVTVDTSTMEMLLTDIRDKIQGVDYADLINALNNLGAKLDGIGANLGINGIQRILGFSYNLGAIEEKIIEFNLNIKGFLNGITFFQSAVALGGSDNFDLIIEDNGTETPIFSNVYPKGFGEYKNMDVFLPITSSAKVKIVYHNVSKNNKILWFDFHVVESTASTPSAEGNIPTPAPTIITSDTAKYLRRFVVIDTTDSSYVDPSTIDMNYWTMAAESVPNDFWEGRNTLLRGLENSSAGNKYTNSLITTITNFNKYLFQLSQDIRKNGLVLSDWQPDFNTFMSFCNKSVADGGYGLSSLTTTQKKEIYLTYTLHTITLIFPSCETKLTTDYINKFKTYLPPDRLTVLEWIDFNEVNPNNSIGAFDLDLGDNGDFKTFRTYMNVEPNVLDTTTFNADDDEVLNPSFFKVYNDGQAVNGDFVIQVGFFPGDKWEIKKAGSAYNIGDAKIMPARVFLHELGHGIDFQYGTKYGTRLSDMNEWRDIGGWEHGDAKSIPKLKSTKWASDCIATDKEPPISLYGATLVYEDFAETHSCYCVNPVYLQTYYPKRYAFMEKYVKGFEM